MNIREKEPLLKCVMEGNIIGAMNYLKTEYGISEGFICSNANVNISTYCRYKKGDIKILGADKKEALLNVIKEMYL